MPRNLGANSPLLTKGGRKRYLGPSEKQVEAACDKLCAVYQFIPVRFSQARATNQSPGIPDRKYYRPDRRLTFWFECKRPGGKQSPAQKHFQAMAEACGEHYVVGGVEEVAAFIREQDRRRAAVDDYSDEG